LLIILVSGMNKTVIIVASEAISLINFRYYLIAALCEHGYSVIACAPKNKKVAKKLLKLGVRFHPIPLRRTALNPYSDILLLVNLIKLFKKNKPYKVLSYTHKAVIYTSIAARIVSVPEIYSMITGMGYVFSANGLKSKLVRYIAEKLFKISLSFNHKVFFQNSDNLQFFLDNGLLKDRNKGVLINGSGVDIKDFGVVPFPQNISFLMMARLLVDKGVREYLDAAKIIKQKYPQVQFLLLGGFETNPNSITKAEFAALKNSSFIDYLGELEDVRPILEKAMIYVLPSYCEGMPRSVLEAMAMGRPIITTDVPGCRETVIDGINGFLVPAKNVDGLVASMKKFILKTELIGQMGRESRQLAERKFDVNIVNQKIMVVMECI
jgi:glycosyltransferase involved in cell wall biosynthesis